MLSDQSEPPRLGETRLVLGGFGVVVSQKEVAVDACVVERSCRKASTTDPFYTGECSAVACPANSAGTEASTAEMAGGRV